MRRLGESPKKKIVFDRMRFFVYEISLVFILIFLILLIPLFLIPLIVDEGSILYGVLFYSLRAVFVFIAIPIVLTLSNIIFESQERNIIIQEDISPAVSHLKLYKMSKKNYKYQILYGILIFFFVFLPIDFFPYLFIPGMLEYQGKSIANKSTGSYLVTEDYFIFLISAIIIQLSVSIAEETISRGFITIRGSLYFFKMSAVMVSALYFGLGHFAYFLDPISRNYPISYPFIMFLQAFIVGIILSLLLLRRKWIIPAIIAHTLNNIVSAHSVWSYFQGNDFMLITLYLYIPLLIIGIILFIWQFSRVKESLSIGFNMLKQYFELDETSEQTRGDKIFRVFFDIIIACLIFILGIMIAI
ncbi:MAG: CPBP family intramembrane glutamic endopeptidase [Candidatus Hermodarchaeota archaeon]